MPEAVAVLAVFVVAVVAWFGAWMQAGNPANQNVHDETQRLQLHVRWLEQRLDLARRENWDREMNARLAAEIEIASEQLSRQARQEFER